MVPRVAGLKPVGSSSQGIGELVNTKVPGQVKPSHSSVTMIEDAVNLLAEIQKWMIYY